ncbi:MAG TPA: methylglyoxal synthase [Thermotogota bacterium]|nr:methylglyoxal synthase [Thermotogota bacterium]HPJ88190.1 methylglyoxal synthase [Thermotogota bacterium]HPR95623.1 methylglyoxal synthase [Thermotogota bacterium]
MKKVKIGKKKHIALVAHDFRKKDMIEWVKFNRGTLSSHHLYGTGTTGSLIEKETGLPVYAFKSGPLGGDQQIGAKIAEGTIDCLIFFWDPLSPHSHDVDVKALLRIATLYNIPVAMNRSSADFLISSPLMEEQYERDLYDYQSRHEKETLSALKEE